MSRREAALARLDAATTAAFEGLPDARALSALLRLADTRARAFGLAPADRCPAPTEAEGGWLRCVSTLSGCREPAHRRYDAHAALLGAVWAARPWWPNALGRAQDRGEAHTPLVRPCRACAAGAPGGAGCRRG